MIYFLVMFATAILSALAFRDKNMLAALIFGGLFLIIFAQQLYYYQIGDEISKFYVPTNGQGISYNNGTNTVTIYSNKDIRVAEYIANTEITYQATIMTYPLETFFAVLAVVYLIFQFMRYFSGYDLLKKAEERKNG